MKSYILALLVSTAVSSDALAAELQTQTIEVFERYVQITEARIASELELDERFLVQDHLEPQEAVSLHRALSSGSVYATKLQSRLENLANITIPKGMVHHWFGSVFVRGVTMNDLVAWLQHYDAHEGYFDEVESSRLVAHDEGLERFDIFLRLKRKRVVTVHYNIEHRVDYRRHGPRRVSSASYATRITELVDAGTQDERERVMGNDHGFLWRLNSYWRFQEVPDGVIVECESVSLSRGVLEAVRWIVGPYLDSVPRESLEATLRPIQQKVPRVQVTVAAQP
jgi:hypothetical protein